MDSQKSPIEYLAQKDLSRREEVFQPLTIGQIGKLIDELGSNWSVEDGGKCIEKKLRFSKYMEGVDLVVWLARLAEEVNHHPDIVLGFKTMTLRFTTHNISALSLADFVLAAKIEKHLQGMP